MKNRADCKIKKQGETVCVLFCLAYNVEAMTSKGLRASCLSKYTELGARYTIAINHYNLYWL